MQTEMQTNADSNSTDAGVLGGERVDTEGALARSARPGDPPGWRRAPGAQSDGWVQTPPPLPTSLSCSGTVPAALSPVPRLQDADSEGPLTYSFMKQPSAPDKAKGLGEG